MLWMDVVCRQHIQAYWKLAPVPAKPDIPPSGPQRLVHFDVAVAEGFVLTELAAIVDAIRIANRVAASPVFDWSYRSVGGGAMASASGRLLNAVQREFIVGSLVVDPASRFNVELTGGLFFYC